MSQVGEPLFDRVLLLEDTPEEITAGGIIVPTIAQEKSKTSKVIAVGSDCKYVKVGDHVLHTKFSGVEIEINRVTYHVVAEVELMLRLPAVVPQEATGVLESSAA